MCEPGPNAGSGGSATTRGRHAHFGSGGSTASAPGAARASMAALRSPEPPGPASRAGSTGSGSGVSPAAIAASACRRSRCSPAPRRRAADRQHGQQSRAGQRRERETRAAPSSGRRRTASPCPVPAPARPRRAARGGSCAPAGALSTSAATIARTTIRGGIEAILTRLIVCVGMTRREIRSWLMDMDGVLVHEEQAIPGADRFLEKLRERGAPHLVLTNNSIYTRRDLSARLRASGLEVPEESIWTSALATASFLQDQRPGRQRVRDRRGRADDGDPRRRLHAVRARPGLRRPGRDPHVLARADHARDPADRQRRPVHRHQPGRHRARAPTARRRPPAASRR